MSVYSPISPAVYDALLAEASAPHTSPDRLEQIRQEVSRLYRPNTPARQVKRLFGALLANPNSPPETLSHLAYADPEAILTNPALPLLPLEDPAFIARLHDEVLTQMLRFPNVPAAFVQHAHQRQKGKARRQAEWHIVAVGEADPLSDDWETEAFDAIAALDMNQPEKVFEIVEHHLHDEQLVRIFERIGLAAVHAPVHEGYFKRQRAAARAEKASSRKSKETPVWERTAPPDGDWNRFWSRDMEDAVHAAESPRTPATILRSLAEFTKAEIYVPYKTERNNTAFSLPLNTAPVRDALLRNPATPLEILRMFVVIPSAEWIATHPNADAELLAAVAAEGLRYQRPSVKDIEALMGNPKTPAETVRQLDRYLSELLEKRAAANKAKVNDPQWAFGRRIRRWHPALYPDGPKLPEEVGEAPFDRTMSEYFPKLDYFLLTLVHQYKPDALARIAREPEWTRRFAAVIHPNATPRIWKYLVNDGNRFVRACARQRLSTFTTTPELDKA
jgi:hypothetical protein